MSANSTTSAYLIDTINTVLRYRQDCLFKTFTCMIGVLGTSSIKFFIQGTCCVSARNSYLICLTVIFILQLQVNCQPIYKSFTLSASIGLYIYHTVFPCRHRQDSVQLYSGFTSFPISVYFSNLHQS